MTDWRLTNQQRYLQDVSLRFTRYRKPRDDWEHDHCSFCWAKFMEQPGSDVLHEGYCTLDSYHWVCSKCFEDFKTQFGWHLVDSASPTDDESGH